MGGRTLILDASHNAEGAEALDANLGALVSAEKEKPIVIVGVLGAARAEPLMAAIARHAAAIHLVVLNDPRACSFAELRALIPTDFGGEVVDDTPERLFPGGGRMWLRRPAADSDLRRDAAATATPQTIVVTGSIYLVGEVMKRLEQGG